MYENFTLADAFKALNEIEDESVNIPLKTKNLKNDSRNLAEGYCVDINSTKDIEAVKDILAEDSSEPVLQVIDIDADTLDHLKKKEEYTGQIILKCKACQALRFIDSNLLAEDENNSEIFNLEDECPNCHAEGKGYELVGQVGKVDNNAEQEQTEEIPEEESEEKVSEESEDIKLDNEEKDSEEVSFDNDFTEEPASEESKEEPEEEAKEDIEVDNEIEEPREQEYEETDAEDDTEDLDSPSLGDLFDDEDVSEDDTEVKESLEDDEDDAADKVKELIAADEEAEEEAEKESKEELEEEPEEEFELDVNTFFGLFAEPEKLNKIRILNVNGDVVFEDNFDALLPTIKQANLVKINPDNLIINLVTEKAEDRDYIDFKNIAPLISIDENNLDNIIINLDEKEVTLKKVEDIKAIKGFVESVEAVAIVELVIADTEGIEEIANTELSAEDSLAQEIVKENYLSIDKLDNINSNEYWIRESIRTKEDLDIIFESFVLTTDDLDLINKFKSVTGYKDALDEAREKLGYKADIVENIHKEDLESPRSQNAYDKIIDLADAGPEKAVTSQQLYRDWSKHRDLVGDFNLSDLSIIDNSKSGLVSDTAYIVDKDGNVTERDVIATPKHFEKWNKDYYDLKDKEEKEKIAAEKEKKTFDAIEADIDVYGSAIDSLSKEDLQKLVDATTIALTCPDDEKKIKAGKRLFGPAFDKYAKILSNSDQWGISAKITFGNQKQGEKGYDAQKELPQSLLDALKERGVEFTHNSVSSIALAKVLFDEGAKLREPVADSDWKPEQEKLEADESINCKHCKDRKELAEAIIECKNNNRPFNVKRSTLDGYRYDLIEGRCDEIISKDIVEKLDINEATLSELKQITSLAARIGIETLGDLKDFVNREMEEYPDSKNILDLLRTYNNELGSDFQLKEFLEFNTKDTLNEADDEDFEEEKISDDLATESDNAELVSTPDENLDDISDETAVEDISEDQPEDISEEQPEDVEDIAEVEVEEAEDATAEETDTPVEANQVKASLVGDGSVADAATDVMDAYQKANKWLDSVKECIYTNMNCPFFSSYVHELAHRMPERFDKFGDILHTINMEIPYPATQEIDVKPENIQEAFDTIFEVLNNIKEKLNAFIKCTDEDYHGMACAAEACLNDIEDEYPMLYRLKAKAEECGEDTVTFDKFVAAYVEHKDDLVESLDESVEDICPKCGKAVCECTCITEAVNSYEEFVKTLEDTDYSNNTDGPKNAIEQAQLMKDTTEKTLAQNPDAQVARNLNAWAIKYLQDNNINEDYDSSENADIEFPTIASILDSMNMQNEIDSAKIVEEESDSVIISAEQSCPGDRLTYIRLDDDDYEFSGIDDAATQFEDYIYSYVKDINKEGIFKAEILNVEYDDDDLYISDGEVRGEAIITVLMKVTQFDINKFDTDLNTYFVESYTDKLTYKTDNYTIDNANNIHISGTITNEDTTQSINFLVESLGNNSYKVVNNLSDEIFEFKK